jgi:hypothetical protein
MRYRTRNLLSVLRPIFRSPVFYKSTMGIVQYDWTIFNLQNEMFSRFQWSTKEAHVLI